MSRPRSIRVLVAALLFASIGFAQAQTAPQNPAAAPQQAQGKDQEKPKEPEKPKTIDDMTKDFTKMEGLVTIYRQFKDKKDTVYLELPESKLGKLMLIQVTSASGMGDTSVRGVYHGQPIADIPVKFQRLDEARLQLIAPNLGNRATTPEGQRGIARSFPDTVMSTFEIVAKQPERNSVLLDVTNFFKSDIGDLSILVEGRRPGTGFGIDPSGSRVDTVKNFPENFVVRTVYQLQRRGPASTGDPRSVPWAVSFNVSEIPMGDGYMPRLGDPRVGYFVSYFNDLTDATKQRDANVNYIQRWHLEKSDPSAALSEPKKPIVFYIDNAVPQEYRDAVREGLLMWNPAFEKLGFKDAIVVKQMPDDADWDIADLRYNVIRWTTGMPFAIALFRANPLTGEILNASINMDAVFASGGASSHEFIIDPVTSHLKFLQKKDEDSVESTLNKRWAYKYCDMGQAGQMAHAIGFAAAEVLDPNFSEMERKRIVNEYITEVVSHEMGHCLGLRHNFIGSTQLTMKDLSDPNMVSKYGIGASVMDYSPFNAGAIGHPGVHYYSSKIGTYDEWAIQYGYMDIKASTPVDEISALRKHASKGSTPGYLYQSDGSADDFDPYIVRFDLARQPLDYLETMVDLGPKLRERAKVKIKDGDSYYKFTRTWMAGMNAQVNNALAASQFIGAGRVMTSFKGDPNEQPAYSPVAGATQRRALAIMNKGLFSESSFKISRADLAKLTFNPNQPYMEVQTSRERLFPMQSNVALAQQFGLMALLNSDTLQRMKMNEFNAGQAGNTLTVAEMFHSLDKSVWSEVDGMRPVGDLRRELQRAYLDQMIPMALGQAEGAPNDARDLAMDNLVSLKHRIALALPKAKDSYTGPHLRQCLTRINRALSAQSTVPVGN